MSKRLPDRMFGWDIEPMYKKSGASDTTRWRAVPVACGVGRWHTHTEAAQRAGALNDETEGRAKPSIGRKWQQRNYQQRRKARVAAATVENSDARRRPSAEMAMGAPIVENGGAAPRRYRRK